MATILKIVFWMVWAVSALGSLILFLIDFENAPASLVALQREYVPVLTQLLDTPDGKNQVTTGIIVILLVVWSIPPVLIAWRSNQYGRLRLRFGEDGSFAQDGGGLSIRRVAIENVGGASIERVEVLIDSFTPQGAARLPLPLALMQGTKQPFPLDRARPVYVEVVAYTRSGQHRDEIALRYEDQTLANLIHLRKRPYLITIRACGANVTERIARVGVDIDKDRRLLMWRQRWGRSPRMPRRLALRRLPDSETPLHEYANMRALKPFDMKNVGEEDGVRREDAILAVERGFAEPGRGERLPKSERRGPVIAEGLEALRAETMDLARDAETLRGNSPTEPQARELWQRFRTLLQRVEAFVAAEISPVTARWVVLYSAGESDSIPGRTAMALLWDLREVADAVARKLHDLRKDY